jgi:hypothetical protein
MQQNAIEIFECQQRQKGNRMWLFELILMLIIAFAAIIYIAKKWREAVNKRDAEWMFRPLAGVFDDEHKKPSAFWYLFK